MSRSADDVARQLKNALQTGAIDQAATLLRSGLAPDLDYSSAQALLRAYRLLRARQANQGAQVRIAVAGGYTTSPLASLIDLYLFGAGVCSEVYEAPYGVFRQEILDPQSGLYRFSPKTVFIATGWRDLSSIPALDCDRAQVAEQCRREVDEWRRLWEVLYDRLGCTIIQNNFDGPSWRALGNHEGRHAAGFSSYLARLNLALQEQAPPNVIIHDVDYLASLRGRLAWSDSRFYHYGKLPCAPRYLPEYAASVASLVAAQMGRSKKCLVLDLDNTLWGGVIGDDGLGGIQLGHGDPEGEAFLSFQQYLKGLHDRGVILAVCSKNEESAAREVFEKHPDAVLRLGDFACFLANWTDKVSNLRAISQRLNIGLDSLVFVDDEPRERALVRTMLPQVSVPELPDDPADYIEAIEKHRFFQVVALSEEDFRRADYYRADAARTAAAASAQSLDDFLESLKMRGRAAPIEPATLERCAQLVNRSNQFNLTTRRYSAAELRSRMGSEQWVTLAVSLSDRFGDNGLISVLLASRSGDSLVVDTWVMSCRVLKRTVEQFVFNRLCSIAVAEGLSTIRGEYIATPRNALVRNHYRDLGFKQAGDTSDNDHTFWELRLTGSPVSLPTFVKGED